MRSSVFWDVTQRIALVNQRFRTARVCFLFIGSNVYPYPSIAHATLQPSLSEWNNCPIVASMWYWETCRRRITLLCSSRRVSLIVMGQVGFTLTESPLGLLVRHSPTVSRATDTNRIWHLAQWFVGKQPVASLVVQVCRGFADRAHSEFATYVMLPDYFIQWTKNVTWCLISSVLSWPGVDSHVCNSLGL